MANQSANEQTLYIRDILDCMRDFLHHLLLPRESNNHKAKLLHHSSILFLILFLFLAKFFFTSVEEHRPDILGVSANISPEELLIYTNQKREEKGLAPLVLNPELAVAASRKANDMFTKDYWAHNSPDGATPWIFIKGAGYEYAYAGENLARGFSTSSDVITAWMNSPGHRDNMLSPNYKDIGFAIIPGKLTGDETVLVVEMFGSKYAADTKKEVSSVSDGLDTKPVGIASSGNQGQHTNPVSDTRPSPVISPIQLPLHSLVASVRIEPLVNSDSFLKKIASFILIVLLFIFVLDIIIIEKKKIVRIVSHHIDHVIFLFVIFITILMIGGGFVL